MAVHLGARGRGPLEKFDFVPPAVPNGVGGQCASDSSRAPGRDARSAGAGRRAARATRRGRPRGDVGVR